MAFNRTAELILASKFNFAVREKVKHLGTTPLLQLPLIILEYLKLALINAAVRPNKKSKAQSYVLNRVNIVR